MSLDVYLTANKCEYCGRSDEPFRASITHNLTDMADAAGIYGAVWRPDENGITKAKQLIEPLKKAIAEMKADPERFKKLNPANGWGTYSIFLPWLERYLEACLAEPEANIMVSR